MLACCLGWVLPARVAAQGQEAERPRPEYRLDTLRAVVGTRTSAELPVLTRSVEALTAAGLARQPVRSVPEALAAVLGVDLLGRSPAQADVAIRGGGSEQVLVLVDGMRVSDAQTGHFDLNLVVPFADIERVEILRGPASAVYGADAFGGVINIVTRRSGRTQLTALLEGGSAGTIGGTAGARLAGERLRGGATVEYRRSDGHRPGTDYRTALVHASLEGDVRGRPLRATLGIADRRFGAAQFYTSPAAGFDEFEAARVLTSTLAWAAPPAARLSIEPRLSLRRHDDDYVLRRHDPDFYRNVHRSWQAGAELVARYQGTGTHAALGGEAYRDELESTNLGDRREQRAALFAEAGIGRTGGRLLTAGLRSDWHSAYGTFLAPSVAAAYWIGSAQVRASASRGYRAPTWTERYYRDPANVGDPALEPERAWEAELGLDLRLEQVRLSGSVFQREARALIDWVLPADAPAGTAWRTMNVQSARFRGAELAVQDVAWLGAAWGLRLSTLSFQATSPAGYQSKYALRPLLRQASLECDRPLPAGLALFLRASHARRAGADGYTLLDARLSRSFTRGRLFLDLTNLTDTHYLDVSAMPAPGAAARLGAEWRWER